MKPKVVILAGGLGSRLSEETVLKPKPMVEIGGRPILWHIMKLYSSYGFNDFIICLGYKGYMIKEYFSNYFLHQADLTIDIGKNALEIHKSKAEPWKITLVDTGEDTMTGGRIKRIQSYVGNKTFMLTYGDGVADVDIQKLYAYHKKNKKTVTLTAVKPSGRFGALEINNKDEVVSFKEKPSGDNRFINGGFFVLEPGIFDYIASDDTTWEKEPLENLAKEKEVASYKHYGFWMCMDTLRDKNDMENLWAKGLAPWKKWKQ